MSDPLSNNPETNGTPSLLTPRKSKEGITKLNNRKPPASHQVRASMLKELPIKGVIRLLHLFNSI